MKLKKKKTISSAAVSQLPNTYLTRKQRWAFKEKGDGERPTRPHWANLREPPWNHSGYTIRLLFIPLQLHGHSRRRDPIIFRFLSRPLHMQIGGPGNTLFGHGFLSLSLSLSLAKTPNTDFED
jgi:hypothetical protein